MTTSLALAALALSPHASAQTTETYTEVPVVVNVHRTLPTTATTVREAIAEANRMLKSWRIRLVLVGIPVQSDLGDDGSGGGTAGDGQYTADERRKAIEAGLQELTSLAGLSKGIKIYFVDRPEATLPDCPGASEHRQHAILCKDRGSANLTAQTLIHELGHICTLAGGTHEIGDPAFPSSCITSDDDGHAPDTAGANGRGNVMAPSNWRAPDGDPPTPVITPKQLETIRGDGVLEDLGDTVTVTGDDPPVPEEQHAAAGPDPRDDAVIEHADVIWTALHSTSGDDVLSGTVTFRGLLPVYDPFYDTLLVGFEYDGAHSGNESGVQVAVSRAKPGGPLDLYAVMFNSVTGANEVLPLLDVAVSTTSFDLDAAGVPTRHQLIFEASRALLGLDALAADAAVTVNVTATAGYTWDDQTLAYLADLATTRPQIAVDAWEVPAGEVVRVDATGLPPNAAWTLLLDEAALATGTTDAAGALSTDATIPGDTPTGRYFLTADDGLGSFAFTILSVEGAGTTTPGTDGTPDTGTGPGTDAAGDGPPPPEKQGRGCGCATTDPWGSAALGLALLAGARRRHALVPAAPDGGWSTRRSPRRVPR